MSLDTFCKFGIKKFGEEPQTEMAIEEMSELIVALQHYKRGRATIKEVCDEVADVIITVNSLRFIFDDELIQAKINKEMNRW